MTRTPSPHRNAPAMIACSVALAVMLSGCMSTEAAGLQGAGPLADGEVSESSRIIAIGDYVTYNLAVLDAGGRVLYSTTQEDVEKLEAARAELGEPFEMPDSFKPRRYKVPQQPQPMLVGPNASLLLGPGLVGKQTGDQVLLPVIGTFEPQLETVSFQRLRGPFPLQYTISNVLFDNYTKAGEDGQVRLDDLLMAEQVSRNETVTTLRIKFDDGVTRSIPNTPFTGALRLNETQTGFTIHLEAPQGVAFAVESTCAFARYTLTPARYQILGVSEETISLEKSDLIFPQAAGKPLIARVTITTIETMDANGKII